MTDRRDALDELLKKVEAGDAPEVQFHALLSRNIFHAIGAFHGSLDAALALHKAVLPGWWYQVGSCHLSDDARVSPDFNCPIHELSAQYDPAIGWADLTDTDQRPAGNPARAWLCAILKALIEEAKG